MRGAPWPLARPVVASGATGHRPDRARMSGEQEEAPLMPRGLILGRRRSRLVSGLVLASPGEHARSHAAVGVVSDRPHRDLCSVAGEKVASPS